MNKNFPNHDFYSVFNLFLASQNNLYAKETYCGVSFSGLHQYSKFEESEKINIKSN